MDWKAKYGGALLGVGALILWVGQSISNVDMMWVGGILVMGGGALFYLAIEKWYCAACGQLLSRGTKPSRCDRCGSNRVTNSDPGVGRAVRVQDDRGRR